MSNPPTDSNAKTLAGEVVLSLNIRSAIHPSKDSGFLQPDWKHPVEPKPGPYHAAINGTIVNSLSVLGGHATYKFNIDG